MSLSSAILVTDGDQRSALAAARALGRAGCRVFACAPRTPSLAGASRYVRDQAAAPDPLSDAGGFVGTVERLVRQWGIDLLMPVTDASTLALLPARSRFPGVRIPFPSDDVFRRVADKAEVLGHAAALGIATPAQNVLARPEEWAKLADERPPFPVAVKPARSVSGVSDGGARGKFTTRYAGDASELQACLDGFPPEAYPLLVQQRVVGPGVGVFLLLWEGKTLAVFSHRRLREKPPSGGASVYSESVSADPVLVERSRALLERFGWQGVAMVEYKIDARSGTAYLMEVNGRFWGSLQLAVDAGVDFPLLLVRAALGEDVTPVTTYQTGVRCRWWWGDVDHLLVRLRRSRDQLVLPPDAPSRWRVLRDFLTVWRPGDRSEILRWDDPWPFVRESLDWVRALRRRRP